MMGINILDEMLIYKQKIIQLFIIERNNNFKTPPIFLSFSSPFLVTF